MGGWTIRKFKGHEGKNIPVCLNRKMSDIACTCSCAGGRSSCVHYDGYRYKGIIGRTALPGTARSFTTPRCRTSRISTAVACSPRGAKSVDVGPSSWPRSRRSTGPALPGRAPCVRPRRPSGGPPRGALRRAAAVPGRGAPLSQRVRLRRPHPLRCNKHRVSPRRAPSAPPQR